MLISQAAIINITIGRWRDEGDAWVRFHGNVDFRKEAESRGCIFMPHFLSRT